MVMDGENGIVVTNHHLVEGATSIEVTIATTGQTYTATLLGADATHDIAVLELTDAPALDEVTLDTDALEVRDQITAVGDAGGDGGTLTAATGTITDTRAPVTVTDDDGTQTTIRGLIEVDADIIAGDSGGALLDADGDVIGMNVAASSGTTDITGYAIPVARVLRVASAVLAGDGSATIDLGYDAFLGIALSTRDTDPATATKVLEGGAADAGLPAGDTITALDGHAIESAGALRRWLARYNAGDTISLSWTDDAGESDGADATLGRAPIA
nr:trypsin-like peptidase domain-containing protein [Nocardioides sp. IC4_145]